eukprot:1757681-Pyramimonas_sp.AAC.1
MKPRTEDCYERRRIARLLLDTPDCCPRRRDSDIAAKLKLLFHDDFNYSANSGLLTAPLAACLMALRAVWPLDTQSLEGINSVIQVMCKRAPHMSIPLLNARLSTKKNIDLTARELADLDPAASEYMKDLRGDGIA